jgi:predicted enzyme related to lactoylglutathione lyase
MTSVLTEICVDCHDPARVAAFWSEVLGWEIQHDDDSTYLWMSASGRPGEGIILVFIAVPEPKTVKDRIHLDVNPKGCTRDEEVARLVGLGATRVDVGQGDDVGWVVLADVEGNEFCVLGRRID